MRNVGAPVVAARPALHWAWLAALLLAVGAVWVPAGGGAAQLGPFPGYPSDVAQNIYRLIRVGMPWLPAGVLLALALPASTIRLAVLVAVTCGIVLAIAGMSGSASLSLARDLLFVIPGVAAGLWLAERSSVAIPGSVSSRLAGLSSTAKEAGPAVASMPPGLDPVVAAHGALESAPVSGLPRRMDVAAMAGPLIGIALVAAALFVAGGFPRWGVPIAIGLGLYAAVVWWRPLASLVAVPAALPLLDLAPWTGRFFLDEFDLLMAVTVGMLLLRRRGSERVALAPLGRAAVVLFLVTAAVALGLGLFPLAPLDANTFSSYWSPLNAVRVGKGIVWGTLLCWMLRRVAGSNEAVLARWLGLGMALGLLGVALVGTWERWLFAGLADEYSRYRIFSTFSSMHTGGGHIEAYLVAAVPFLWLGLFRYRTAVLVVPVLLLSAYVMLFTVARGGVLAFVVVAAVLVAATVRLAWRAGSQRAARPLLAVLVLVGVTAVVAAGAGGGYLLQRFAQTEQDWDIRVAHWRLALRLQEATWGNQLFGHGLGSFPRSYLWHGPPDRQAASYSYRVEGGNTFLRMGVGETLYVAQRVAVQGGSSYKLQLALRSSAPSAVLSTPLCEKQMLNSRRCDWHRFSVPGDGQWHTVTHDFTAAKVGAGPPWQHLPVELYFHNGSQAGVIDIDRVSLVDGQGQELVGNGDFAQGGDYWFFKTQSHLPWHIKNFWIHTYVEMGAAGLLATVLLTALAMLSLARAGWRGSRLAWALLASLAGLLTVGIFDSLVDAPRLATLLVGWSMFGATLVWRRPAAPASGAG